MKKWIILIIISNLVLIITSNQSTKTVISELYFFNDRFQMKMKVGTPYIVKSHVINQEKEISWFYNVLYDSALSKTSKLLYNTYQGEVFSDIFQFDQSDIVFNAFPYQLGNKNFVLNSSVFGGGYSLPYKFNDTSHSLIHQLRKSNHINSLSYALILNSKQLGPRIQFGSFPEEIRRQKKGGHCLVIPNQAKWSCAMPQVSIGSYDYRNTHPAHFQLAEKIISAPSDFMDFVFKTVFKQYIDSNQCGDLEERYLYCYHIDNITLPFIQFTFDHYAYSFPLKHFFEPVIGVHHFLIEKNQYDENAWIIGSKFLQFFDSQFDYEKGIVELFSGDVLIEQVSVLNSKRMQCLLILASMLLFGVIMQLYWVYIKHKALL